MVIELYRFPDFSLKVSLIECILRWELVKFNNPFVFSAILNLNIVICCINYYIGILSRSDNTFKRAITIYRDVQKDKKNEYFFVKKIVSRISRHCYITIEATRDTMERNCTKVRYFLVGNICKHSYFSM